MPAILSQSIKRERSSSDDKLPDEIVNAADKEPFRRFELLHIVRPRSNAPGKTAKQKPFLSVYVHAESRKVVQEGGFDEMPYIVSRWQKNSMEV